MKLPLAKQDVFVPNCRFGIASKAAAVVMFGSFALVVLSSGGLVQTVSAASATDRVATVRTAAAPAKLAEAVSPMSGPVSGPGSPSAVPAKISLGARLKPAVLGRHMMSGMASWYGKVLAGRHTASGEVFDPSLLTAAHRTLPFGTLVRVTDLANHLSVVVKINDRGTLNADRAIDLSYAAAQQLQMVQAGTHPVRLEILPRDTEVQETPRD